MMRQPIQERIGNMIAITKDQFEAVLLDSGKFPNEDEDFKTIDEIWEALVSIADDLPTKSK